MTNSPFPHDQPTNVENKQCFHLGEGVILQSDVLTPENAWEHLVMQNLASLSISGVTAGPSKFTRALAARTWPGAKPKDECAHRPLPPFPRNRQFHLLTLRTDLQNPLPLRSWSDITFMTMASIDANSVKNVRWIVICNIDNEESPVCFEISWAGDHPGID